MEVIVWVKVLGLGLTLTFNPWRTMVMTHTYAKSQGQRSVVQKTEWKQSDRQTDGRRPSHYLPC